MNDLRVKSTALRVLEGAYDTAGTHEQWIGHAARTLTEGTPGAIAAWGYALQGGQHDGGPGAEALLTAFQVDDDTLAHVFSGSGERLSSLALGPGTRCAVYSETLRHRGTAGKRSARLLQQVGGDDAFAVMSIDAARAGIIIACVTRDHRLSEERREVGTRIAVHLAAGLRLRRALGTASLLDHAEAIFEADGRLASARGPASQGDTPERLHRAVERVAGVHRAVSRDGEIAALDLWQGLVEGRWSIVAHEDTDGRRYHLAVANPPLAVLDRALTATEAHVAAMALAGEPYKTIAYSLGIGESTAANVLKGALRKLGVASRIELIRFGTRLGLAPAT